MGRRGGFASAINQIQREAERAARAKERELTRAQKEREREQKQQHLEGREEEVATLNASLVARMTELEGLLEHTLTVDDYIDWDRLRQSPEVAPFEPGELAEATPPPAAPTVQAPKGLGKLLPGATAKYEHHRQEADRAHKAALEEHARVERSREERLRKAKEEHAKRVREAQERADQHNSELDAFRKAFEAGEPRAVVEYYSLVLQNSKYPSDFPRHSKLAYVPESKQLVVEFDLPSFEVVPDVRQYKYVKTRDDITATARPMTERRSLYQSAIAQIAVRTLHEIFEADRHGQIETVVFNGHVDAIDPGTGQDIRPCLVTCRATQDAFECIDLARVDPVACLQTLNASFSKKPSDLVPVRPVLEFSMVDSRYVEETDVLSDLDARPNLMELTPQEFESLVTNLFQTMGLETRQTRPSRDGGVDCVAFDPRPIFGGKVVIQAKRYKNTVGVTAVRDLFGTLQNEGASKGILVTTSGYGKASFEFAEGKPIELLSGSNLLYLLAEHVGIEAKIEAPDDWVDPGPNDE